MNKQKLRVFLSIVCFFLSSSALLAQQFKLDQCFPDSTQIYVSINNVKDLGDHWRETQLYDTLSSSQFQEFRDSLLQQIDEAWPNRLGLNVDDFASLPSGELAGGLIAIPGKLPGFAVVMNVEGNASEVNDFLVRLIRETTEKQNGEATKERIVVGRQSVEATVLKFPNKQTGAVTTVWYVALPQLLIATDQKYLAELLLRRLAGEKLETLNSRPEYQAIFERCAQDSRNRDVPQIRFFANPMLAGEAIRSFVPADQLKGESPFKTLSNQGFDGIKGVGGTIDFKPANEKYEFVYRIKVYIPEPATKALRMLSFTNVDSLEPPKWISQNATRYTLVNFNGLTTFNNFGPLFDEFVGTPGAWNDVLDSLEKDKVGPQVNLRTDLVANFGRQVSSTNAFNPENTADGEKFVLSFNILEGKEQLVADALERMFLKDPDFQKVELNGSVFWQYVPEKKEPGAGRPGGTRPGGTRPGGTRPGAARPNTAATSAAADPVVESELIKGVVFGVANGALFVSNDPVYLQNKVLNLPNGSPSILNSPEHQRALQFLAQEPGAANGLFIRGYSRNVDGLRENYELFRQGKLPQGQTLGAKLLNVILTPPGQKTPREIKFDASTLPSFNDTLAKNIGFSLFFGSVENDGLFFKGFSVAPEK